MWITDAAQCVRRGECFPYNQKQEGGERRNICLPHTIDAMFEIREEPRVIGRGRGVCWAGSEEGGGGQ